MSILTNTNLTDKLADKMTDKNINNLKNNTFRKSSFQMKLVSILVISTMISANATAQSVSPDLNQARITTEQKQQDSTIREEVGFGTGAVIGAIFGGPIGALVVGLAGNFVANYVNETVEVEDLTLALNQEKQLYQTQLAKQKQSYDFKLQSAEQDYQTELLALQQNYQVAGQLQAENLLMSLQFSTGSSVLASHYDEQINALASLLNRAKKLSIDLSGYTDMQGDEKSNENLSLARVNSVKNALVLQGVAENRITTYSFGEGQPVIATAQKEISFYDRRVVVKVHNNLGQVAKSY